MLSAKCELLDSLMFSNLLQERDIMNMKTWVAMLGLCLLGLLLLAGCNKKENTNEEQGTSPTSGSKPSQTSAPIDQSTAAKVSGTVTFGGAAPKPAKIDMSQDAGCQAPHQAENIVVGSGKLAKGFVYLKEGLGDRNFDVPSDKGTLEQNSWRYHPHRLGG